MISLRRAKHADFIFIHIRCLGLDLNVDTQDKLPGKVVQLYLLFRLLYQLCKVIILHERRQT